jgi:hypothetical protein
MKTCCVTVTSEQAARAHSALADEVIDDFSFAQLL